jgi:hypothetical protein
MLRFSFIILDDLPTGPNQHLAGAISFLLAASLAARQFGAVL